MKKWISIKYLPVLFLVLISSCKSTLNNSEGTTDGENYFPALIPLPQNVTEGSGFYIIPKDNTICYSDGSELAASWLQELL